MAENKTRPSKASVAGVIAGIKDPERRKDCATLVKMMRKATGEKPVMWATMVGFGQCHYKYESGHEGDCFLMGFASRKPDIVLYIMNWNAKNKARLASFGKHKLGKSCLYIRRLADIDMKVLESLVAESAAQARKQPGSPCS